MEKILVAIDGVNLDRSTLTFAYYLARLTRSKITAVFLENIVSEERTLARSMSESTMSEWEMEESIKVQQEKVKLIEQNIQQCRDFFNNHGIICSVHRDRGVPAQEIIEESRYADILLVDAQTSFKKHLEGVPTDFVKEILAEAECPVIVAPESFDGVDEIIFAYNGTRSSMFAIKQFTYLFTGLEDKKITILNVNEGDNQHTIDRHKFKEWLQNHYSNIHFEELTGQTETELLGYLLRKTNVFIVMGAYGRNIVSKFLKHSRADILIKTITQPIFIAHY